MDDKNCSIFIDNGLPSMKVCQIAKKVLSKPFNGIENVCAELDITRSDFADWYRNSDLFRRSVLIGYEKGMAAANDILFELAMKPSSTFSPALLKSQYDSIYGDIQNKFSFQSLRDQYEKNTSVSLPDHGEELSIQYEEALNEINQIAN